MEDTLIWDVLYCNVNPFRLPHQGILKLPYWLSLYFQIISPPCSLLARSELRLNLCSQTFSCSTNSTPILTQLFYPLGICPLIYVLLLVTSSEAGWASSYRQFSEIIISRSVSFTAPGTHALAQGLLPSSGLGVSITPYSKYATTGAESWN